MPENVQEKWDKWSPYRQAWRLGRPIANGRLAGWRSIRPRRRRKCLRRTWRRRMRPPAWREVGRRACAAACSRRGST